MKKYVALIFFTFLLNCKISNKGMRSNDEGASQVKFDSEASQIIHSSNVFKTFQQDQIKLICNLKSLIIFIANSEHSGEYFFPANPNQEYLNYIQNYFVESDAKRMETMRRVEDDLGIALSKNDCPAELGPYIGETHLLIIGDGPGVGDSYIRTQVSKFENGRWVSSPQKLNWSWKGDGRGLVLSNESFEINLPKNIKFMTRRMIDILTENQKPFDQINYIFKSHGGLFGRNINEDSLVYNFDRDKYARSLFLFDLHDENGNKIFSNFVMPSWSRKKRCEILREPNCDEQLIVSSSDKSGTDKSGTDKSGTDKSGTDKSGTDKSGTDYVGPVFIEIPDITPFVTFSQREQPPANEKIPEAYFVAGQAAIYDSSSLPLGTHRFMTNSDRTGNASPNFYILESCFGAEYFGEKSLRGNLSASVTIFNTDQLYTDLINYSTLSSTQLTYLPFIYHWRSQNPELNKLGTLFQEKLASGIDTSRVAAQYPSLEGKINENFKHVFVKYYNPNELPK